MKACANCKWWSEREFGSDTGQCNLPYENDSPMILLGYHADGLLTEAGFYCKGWQKKEKEDEHN